MADWVLYPVDRLATITDTTASNDASNSANCCRIDPSSLWVPGTQGAGETWSADCQAAYTVDGVAFGNHNFSGEQIKFYKDNSLGGLDTAQATRTFPSNNHDVVFVESMSSIRYFSVEWQSAISSGQCGTISLLDNGVTISEGGPYAEIDRSLQGGFTPIIAASGAEIHQIVGGARQAFVLQLQYLPSGDGNIGQDLWDSFLDNNGWANGVWLTDDEFGSVTANQGRGYYCHVQGPVQSSIINAVGHVSATIPLLEMTKGITGTF